MRIVQHLKTLLLITLLAFTVSGVVNAKVASGPQNLSPGLHQGEAVFNLLTHQGIVESSYNDTSGSSVVAKGAGASYSTPQLQHEFKHASDFGVTGNWDKANGEALKTAINNHISNPTTKAIQGTYKGQPVTHYYNPSTGNNVFVKSDGSFWGGWKLSSDQIKHITTHGGLK